MRTEIANSLLEVPLYRLDNHQPIIDINGVQSSIVFRNCLLSAFYSDYNLDWNPNESFAILDASMYKCLGKGKRKGWDVQSIKKKLSENWDWSFDFAGGSKKHGRYFASKSGSIISDYFEDKDSFSRITTHGSVFTSHCYNGMWLCNDIKIVIVDDNDPYYQEQLRVGDGFGLISEKAVAQLSPIWNGQTQFRMGQKATDSQKGWIAKGTLQVKPALLVGDQEIDIILCLSHLKGNKLEPEMIHTLDDVYLGAMASSNKVKDSIVPTAVLNLLKSEPVQIRLIEEVSSRVKEINNLRVNLKALAQWVIENSGYSYNSDIDGFLSSEDYECLQDFTEQIEEEQLYQSIETEKVLEEIKQKKKLSLSQLNQLDSEQTIAYIIFNAKYPEQIYSHPKICKWASNVLGKAYRKTALTAGLKAKWLMAAPDWKLPRGVVATDAIPSGRYLMWRLPIESQASVDYVQVVSAKHYFDQDDEDVIYNNVFINPDYFARFGGDYDGDCVNFFSLTDYPEIVDEIEEWTELPFAEKPPKGQSSGDKYEIAAKAVDVNVGQPFNLMMQFYSLGLMTDELAIQFAQQIKIATDSYKTDASPDKDFLTNMTMQASAYLGDNLHWLTYSQHKNPDTYISKPIITDCDDTISLMINAANRLWYPIVWSEKSPTHAFRFLFSDVSLSDSILDAYKPFIKKYQDSSITWSKATKDMPEKNKAKLWTTMVYEPFHKLVIGQFEQECNRRGYNVEEIEWQRYCLAAIFHRIFSYKGGKDSNDYRMNTHLFKMFPNEYISCLNIIHWRKMVLWRHSDKSPNSYPDKIWDGTEILTFQIEEIKGELYMTSEGKIIGRVSKDGGTESFIPMIGLTGQCIIKSVLTRDGRISRNEAFLTYTSN